MMMITWTVESIVQPVLIGFLVFVLGERLLGRRHLPESRPIAVATAIGAMVIVHLLSIVGADTSHAGALELVRGVGGLLLGDALPFGVAVLIYLRFSSLTPAVRIPAALASGLVLSPLGLMVQIMSFCMLGAGCV